MNRRVEEARTRALKKIRAKISHDQRKVSHRVARLLQVLKKRPFEASLTMEEARKEAGIRDSNYAAQFREDLDVGPYDYRQRLEVDAADAMIEENLQVPTALVLAAVGLPNYATARRAYRRCDRRLKIYQSSRMEARLDYYNYSLLQRGKLSEERARELLWLLEDIEISEAVDDDFLRSDRMENVMEFSLAEVRRQIHGDRILVPIHLDKVLAHIAKNLTEPQLNANTAIAGAGFKDESMGDQLKFYLGSTIKVYIDKSQMGLVAHRLGETSMLVSEVGGTAGILCERTLRDTFKRCTGERPLNLRLPVVETRLTYDTWSRAGLGDYNAVRETIAVLQLLVPDEASKETTIVSESFERWYAETEIWPTLQKLSFAEARREAQRPVFAGMALVNMLRQKSREEGREDRPRGVELAKLARYALLGVTPLSGDALREEMAKGWAWIGNALRLALDFSGAEDAFKKAFEELERRETEGPSSVVGDIYYLKVSLRIYQRQHKEAIELAELSLSNFRMIGHRAGEIKALEIRAMARAYAGMLEAALVDTKKILTLQPDDHLLTFRKYHTMAFILERDEKFERASEALEAARKISTSDPLWQCHLSWTDACIHHGLRRIDLAEVGYRESFKGFSTLGESLYASLVSLDLAICCLDSGRYPEAIEISLTVVTYFSSMKLNSDVFAALQVLSRALDELSLEKNMLLVFRDAVRCDPTLSSTT